MGKGRSGTAIRDEKEQQFEGMKRTDFESAIRVLEQICNSDGFLLFEVSSCGRIATPGAANAPSRRRKERRSPQCQRERPEEPRRDRKRQKQKSKIIFPSLSLRVLRGNDKKVSMLICDFLASNLSPDYGLLSGIWILDSECESKFRLRITTLICEIWGESKKI